MNEAHPAKRQPVVALALALIMPGMGHIYSGYVNRGMLYFLGLGISSPISAWLAMQGPDSIAWIVLILVLLLSILIYIYAAVDAFRIAQRTTGYVTGECNQPWVYISLFVFGLYFYASLIGYTRATLAESFRIPSRSMVPTVLQGDFIIADKRVNCPRCKHKLSRGDIVIFVNPNERTQLFIKRIIGLPGDVIEIDGTRVSVNGKLASGKPIRDFGNQELNKLLETHVAISEQLGDKQYSVIWKKSAQRAGKMTIKVPNGRAFLLGDNRDSSKDSRAVGTVPLIDIIGKSKQIWLSYHSQSGVRWQRVGRNIQY